MKINNKYGVEFMDLKTLAVVKSISIHTLRKFARQDGMPHYRNGRKILVDPVEFDKWFLNRNIAINNGVDLDELINDALQ